MRETTGPRGRKKGEDWGEMVLSDVFRSFRLGAPTAAGMIACWPRRHSIALIIPLAWRAQIGHWGCFVLPLPASPNWSEGQCASVA